MILVYRSRALLGPCAYNFTGRKYAPISEMHLVTNDVPRIGSAVELLQRLTASTYLGQEWNLHRLYAPLSELRLVTCDYGTRFHAEFLLREETLWAHEVKHMKHTCSRDVWGHATPTKTTA